MNSLPRHRAILYVKLPVLKAGIGLTERANFRLIVTPTYSTIQERNEIQRLSVKMCIKKTGPFLILTFPS